MLDLIRKGWRWAVRFFTGGKASRDRGVLESTQSASPVSAREEVSPDQSVMESTGTAHSISHVSKGVEVSLDRDGVKKTGQEIPATTHSTSPVSTGKDMSPDQSVVESTRAAQSADTLSPPPVPTVRTALPYDFSRWTISEYVESPFEKCGRLYIEGDDLVIRSDLDTRGFRVRLIDVVAVLNGEPQDIRLLKTGKKVGTARLSASGKAMNFLIEPFLYTLPLSRVMDVLEGRTGKAAVFVGRDVVEG